MAGIKNPLNLIIPDETAQVLIRNVARIAGEKGYEVYPVGGFVRDCLLGIKSHDIDFTVLGDAIAFADVARSGLRGRGLVVYRHFGTASLLSGNFKLEFATAREETYDPGSRKPAVRGGDLSADLSRRDFTINSLAVRVEGKRFGEIIDPYNGMKDLKKKLIRTPLDPEKTFSEDPLRILRAARFAGQLGFRIEPATLAAMEAGRNRLSIVSQERITDEFLKILSQPVPSTGLRILYETRVLEIVFPELVSMVGVEQKDTYHHKDVFDHTLKVLDNLAQVTENPVLRFTALVHDIGKPRVKRFVEGSGWTFYGHELVGVRMLKQIIPRMRLSREYLRYTQKMTRLHMRPLQLIGEGVTDSAIRRLLVHAGDEIKDLMMLCRADITSGNPKRVEKHLENFDYVAERMLEVEEKDRMRAFQSPVRGDEIMQICGISPGPMVGKLKKMIEEAILDGLIPNEHEAAFRYLLEIKNEELIKAKIPERGKNPLKKLPEV